MTIRTPARSRADADADARAMTIAEHLRELRRRILVSVAAAGMGAIVVFVLFDRVLSVLVHPYCVAVGSGHACNLYVTGPLDGLSIRVEVAAYGGLVLASPLLLFHFWRFVAPGLRPRERRFTVPFVVSSVVLFIGGAAVAFAVFPHAIAWLGAIGGPSLRAIYSPSSYLGLLLLMMAAFGLTFELPVLLVSLQLAGVVMPSTLASWRRYAVVALVAFAAIVTPSSDPFSMFAMAVPLVVLYEASILLGRLLLRSRR
jgi:sec-independent protein translocase protein TatC